MEALVLTNNKGQDVTTSLIVAEVFGKEHRRVLQDIRDLHCSSEFHVLNFVLIESEEVTHSPVIQPKYYEITKDGFSFLVMGYTGEKAAQFKEKFIAEFNKRDALLRSDDYILSRALEISHNRMRALEAANETLVRDIAQLGTKTLEQEKALEAAAPKVLFADCVTGSDKSILVADLAKILKQNGIEIGQNRLFIWLRDHGYLCSRGAYYNRPTQKAMEMGLFEVIERTIGMPDKELTTFTTKITGKGQVYFVNKFLYQKK